MLRTTHNLMYRCDRCGFLRVYVHPKEDWIPGGWRVLAGRSIAREQPEAKHFCPDCARELFGAKGLAWDCGEEREVEAETVPGRRARNRRAVGGRPAGRRRPPFGDRDDSKDEFV